MTSPVMTSPMTMRCFVGNSCVYNAVNNVFRLLLLLEIISYYVYLQLHIIQIHEFHNYIYNPKRIIVI